MAVQAEWLEKNYYEVLGVPETATDNEISRAYRRLARRLHPDVNPGNKEAEERFKEVAAAYDVVGDSAKRQEYDEARRLMRSGLGGTPFGFGEGRYTVRIDDLGDLHDLGAVGGIFRDVFSGGRGTGRRRPGWRGSDVEAEVALSFEESVFGVTTDVVTADEAGRPRQVRVRIPAGVSNAQLVRVPGRGHPGRDGGPPGDLYVVVRVAPHPTFGRDGDHLTVTVPITYPEAVLGAEVEVPTLERFPVTIRIPPGTPSGKTFRVRGHGVPYAGGRRGDLLVTVEVAVPQRVSGKERKAVQALAKVTPSPRAELGV